MKSYRSRYTLWAKGGAGPLLLNTLSGAVDPVSPQTARLVSSQPVRDLNPSNPAQAMLLDRGYYVQSLRVERAVARWLLAKARQEAAARTAPKYVLSITGDCNLACPYCWQSAQRDAAAGRSRLMTRPMARAALDYLRADLARRGRSPREAVVVLFGGEPLIDAREHHRLVRFVGERCLRDSLRLHITTNGKDLAAFAAEIADFRPSIQVTADGVDLEAGRPCLLRNGRRLPGLYDTLADLAAAGKADVFLRLLVSRRTAGSLVTLADAVMADCRLRNHFALVAAPIQDKTGHSSIGRAARVQQAFAIGAADTKSQVLAAVLDCMDGHPYAHRIIMRDWRSLTLLETVRPAEAAPPKLETFYHCEANAELTCLGNDGRLYACYEAAGEPDLAFGSYWPAVRIDRRRLARFRDHSAFANRRCAACDLSPICGGGCIAYRLKNRRRGMKAYCADLRAEVNLVLGDWQRAVRTFRAPAADGRTQGSNAQGSP